MTQPDLFDIGPRDATISKRPKIQRPKIPCTAGPIGSGPKHETCGSCLHKTSQGGTAGHYLKCALMKHYWTHGAGSDIKARWAACEKWEPQP
jgi:hypothetical protein